MPERSRSRCLRVFAASAALAAGIALLVPVSTAAHAAARKKKSAKEAPAIIAVDLSALGLPDDPALTIELPPTLWRAHKVLMLDYPSKNQLSSSATPRIASRWLLAERSDGRVFNAEVFIVAERRDGDSLRPWARRIANEWDGVFPFEDAQFDGPWIINDMMLKVGDRKRLRGYLLENSGGREGGDKRYVWQFALVPFPEGAQTMIGVKRVSPTAWPGGSRGASAAPGASGGVASGGTVGQDPAPPGEGAGASGTDTGDSGGDTGGEPAPGTEGSGKLAEGVDDSGDLGNSTTEADGNQERASSELLRAVLLGLHVKDSDKLTRGLHRFRLRDEWNGSNNELTSRYVEVDVPGDWRTTPTTGLHGRDRIEWTERDDDGAVVAVYRVEFVSPMFTGEIAPHAEVYLKGWGIPDASLDPVTARDGTTQAAVCLSEFTSSRGLREGDDKTWPREAGFVMAKDTFYVVTALRAPGEDSRLDVLRDMLESFDITIAQ